MTKKEITELLLAVQAVDNRDVTQVTVEAWYEILGHLTLAEARTALAEFRRRSSKWVTPADIVEGCRDPWVGRERFGGPDAA